MLKKISAAALIVFLMLPIVAYGYSASSFIAMDAKTGTVLCEGNAYAAMPMASTTKIMTCLLACESNHLDDVVVITEEMLYDTTGTSLYLKAGDRISFLDLIKGAMLASGNDAAQSLAVAIGGGCGAFVNLMNEKAADLGMRDTLFETPSGLDKGNHHSTAYDMALLASCAMQNDLFKSICSMKSAVITINDIEQTIYNHNKLLSFDSSFVGVKTGFTKKSGRCLVSAYDYNDNLIIAVTLNAPDDWNDHKALVEACKGFYSAVQINDVFDINTVGAGVDKVRCSAEAEIYALGDVTKKAYYYPMIYAPAKSGDIVGREDIYSNGKLIMTVDIIVREDVELWQITK